MKELRNEELDELYWDIARPIVWLGIVIVTSLFWFYVVAWVGHKVLGM